MSEETAFAVFAGHAALFTGVWTLLAVLFRAGLRQVKLLSDVLNDWEIEEKSVERPAGGRNGPKRADRPTLSVVIAARDEAARIENTVRRVLAQSYPRLQVVVVNDRSTDSTGVILDRIAREPASEGRLDVVHNTELPPGWLGKCYACALGADRASGDWLLFMDGDVSLVTNDLLERILGFAVDRGFDHVAVVPDMNPMGRLQAALVAVFGQVFMLATRAHEMDRDRPRGGAGVGAFNLVAKSAYDSIGGHSLLKMDPGDDVKLGLLLKESGARQRLYNGHDLVKCPWQSGPLGIVRGLEKNAFSGCNYSLTILSAFSLAFLWITVGPLVQALAAWSFAGRPDESHAAMSPTRAVGWVVIGLTPFVVQTTCMLVGWIEQGRRLRVPLSVIALYPLGVLLLLVAMWNSALRALSRGGIEWRGTFYPIDELRRGLVHPGDGRKARGYGLHSRGRSL